MEQFFRGITDSFQQCRSRELAATINAYMQNILNIEFKINPGTPDRYDSGGIEQFTASMTFAIIVSIEKTWRTLQLRNNNPFCSVDDKNTVSGHQRKGPKKYFLFFDIPYRLNSCFRIHIKCDKPDNNFQRNLITHPSLLALFNSIFRLTKFIPYELKRTLAVKILYWKNRL